MSDTCPKCGAGLDPDWSEAFDYICYECNSSSETDGTVFDQSATCVERVVLRLTSALAAATEARQKAERERDEANAKLTAAGFDEQAVLEWQRLPSRPDAALAFTEGAERKAATLIEIERIACNNRLTAAEEELGAAAGGGGVATERMWVKAKRVVEGMSPSWFSDVNKKKKLHHDGRTVNEQCFDSGVFAASEMIRRLTGDEELALAVHEACIWRIREHASGTAKTYT